MHQTRSKTQLLKNSVIALSVASLDPCNSMSPQEENWEVQFKSKSGRGRCDHNSNLLWGEHGHKYEGLGGRLWGYQAHLWK